MSDPGKDIDISSYTLGLVESYLEYADCTTAHTTAANPFLTYRYLYHRDPSANNPVSVGGWRSPSSYHHRSYVCSPFSPDSSYHERLVSPGSPCDTRQENYYSGGAGDLGETTPWPSWDPSLENRAITKMRLKLLDQKVNFSTNLAEMKQTMHLFKQAAEYASDLLHSYRHIRHADFSRMLKGGSNRASQAFLAYMYGVRPLISDVSGALDLIAHRSSIGDCFRATVDATERGPDRRIVWSKTMGGSLSTISFPLLSEYKAMSHVSCTYEMQSPVLQTLSQLGITNPAYLLWEEIPFSFVVDWFLPVGNYLNSLSADFGWSFKGGTYSRKESGRCEASDSKTKVDGNLSVNASMHFFEIFDYFSRELFATSPLPSFPSFKNPLSKVHLGEALALLRTRIR